MLELQILDQIQTLHTPIATSIWSFITHLADAGAIWIILTLLLLIIPKTRMLGIILLISMLLDLILCNGIIKPLVGRVRPYDINTTVEILINKPHDFSFPSGHTASSFSFAFALYFAKKRKAFIVIVILAGLIAFSRLYFYVHYPTDILAGIVIGFLCGWGGAAIYKKLENTSMFLKYIKKETPQQ